MAARGAPTGEALVSKTIAEGQRGHSSPAMQFIPQPMTVSFRCRARISSRVEYALYSLPSNMNNV